MSEIKLTAKLERIMFPKGSYKTDGGFSISTFKPIEIEEGEPEIDPAYRTFKVKGEMPPLNEGDEYYVVATEGERHPKFGLTYDLIFMRQNIDFDSNDEKSVKFFLKTILTARQVDALYDAFADPIEIIERQDIEELTKAKGVGKKTAQRIIDVYNSQKDYSFAYIELGKFGLKPKTIKKITDFYKSPELAVEKIKENPYQLMDIDGYAFKTCDKLFLMMGGDINADIRIKSFLIYTLQKEANAGNTWSRPKDLISAIAEYINDVDKKLVGWTMLNNNDIFYLTEDKSKISLRKYQSLEKNLEIEIRRIIEADNEFRYDGWEEDVQKTEKDQGWEFTDQQKDAMRMMLESNICILQGYGGTGKTTTLKAVVDILESKGYLYAQCALSGKASNNLALVTGKDGKTIHRLLHFSPADGGFLYNEKEKLPMDIIIIDEISMVDANIFYHLLLAVRDGAKVIMLGDSEQLESIGVPVMKPMIESEVIPTMTLTQIHRQALKSAIVTDSIKIRKGVQVVKETKGRVVHGELRDLEYELVSDDDQIFINALREFHKYTKVENEDILDVQILTQTKEKGAVSCLSLNKACQKIYNPQDDSKEEVLIGKIVKTENEMGETVDNVDGYYLREGDKVINVRNNYGAKDEEGYPCPVFNGNIGILESFGEDEDGERFMIINFEGIGKVVIDEENFGTIELAYAITVHKSQGSSSKIIIIALPFHYMLNSRQLLYTAITRARLHCIVICTKKTLSNSIKKDNVSNKRTYLREYLMAS